MKKLFTLIVTIVVFASCKTTQSVAEVGTFEILKQESHSSREKASNEVIKSQEKLVALYKDLELTDVPTVDFTKNSVVAIFMGQKSTGGYSTAVDKVMLNNDTAFVEIVETKPQDMATMMLTQPYCIALIPKTSKVEFTKNAKPE